MAKSKKPVEIDEDDKQAAKASESAKKLVTEAIKKYKRDVEAEYDNRKAYREDMLFTFKPGEQWAQADKIARGLDRPMYEFNEARVNAMSVINHIRANRPAAKIRGVEEGDKQLAEIRQGLYLNITNNSDFDSIKDYAAGHQVGGGYGAWRVETQYDDNSADGVQDIIISGFINPLCVIADSSDRDEMKRKAKHWFVHSKLSNDDYDAKYPKADRTSFEPDEELCADLNDEDSTWVAEYWKKVPTTKLLCLLSNGKTIDKDKLAKKQGVSVENIRLPAGVTVAVNDKGEPIERTVKTHKIVQYIISGDAILEGPNDWAGSMFPFVPVYGYYIVIDGRVEWCGLTRYQKDPQRALNWALTSVYESIGNAPQSKIWATPKQALGNAAQWAESQAKNFTYLLYNPDAEAPGPPQRVGGADVPAALINAAGMARDALKASVGIFSASIGQTSNETSGRAIRARQDEGMVATFNFGDNMAKSERRTCEIVNDLFDPIYDTKRNIRILGKDGAEKYMTLNDVDPVTGEVINDMSAGKFDFTITTGPSYSTLRQEGAEFYGQMMQANPAFAAAATDLVLKAQDYPLSDAMAERMKLMLPPQIQQAISKDKPMPPEVQAAMMQVEQLQQQVQMGAQQVAEAAQEAKGEKAAADKAKSDNQVSIANLKVQEANLAKDVADFRTLVAQTQLQMAEKQAATGESNEREQLGANMETALAQIKQDATELITGFAQQLMQMQAAQQPQVIIPPQTRVKHIERQNGRLVPVYEDQQPAQAGGVQ